MTSTMNSTTNSTTNSAQAAAPRSAVANSARRVRVLLVDDQARIGEAVRRMLMNEADIDFQYGGDPTKAIQAAAEFGPTVILQDLVMPEVDGLTMLRFYRANPATREIPVIVLSTKEEPKVKAEAFTLGASDYLVKLPDPIELTARIRHHSRGYIALLERNEAYTALQQSREHLADELSQAAKYVISLLPERLKGDVSTDWSFVPSVELGGDAFGYHWIDADHFAIYLLDVCGHGVKAALLSVSAINILRNQTLPNTDFSSPADVLEGLNRAFQMSRHNDMYFTIWYGVYDKQKRQLSYASGGHPSAIAMVGGPQDAQPVELAKPGMIIGAFPDVTFEAGRVDVPPQSRLYVFSDGIYEIARPVGNMMSYHEFFDLLGKTQPGAKSTIEQTLDAIQAERGSDQFEDDVSIVEVTF
jgi:phosphoserine phosphatase RsbU/P